MEPVEVVVAHAERVTLRVGEVFVKVDGDPERLAVEVEAMRLAPVPTPRVVWRQSQALALAALPGAAIARLGRPATASPAAWAAAGAVVRRLHDAPVPAWPSRRGEERAATLTEECAWLRAERVLPDDLVDHNEALARTALTPTTPVFAHGDLQVAHVFVEDDEVTGVLDWSEAGTGDAAYDVATLTLGHREHLDDVLAGYGPGLDTTRVRAWWSLRSLTAVRWLMEHGFDPFAPGCEVDVLRAQLSA